MKILTIDGYAFKDLNKNGKLDPYEDWRLGDKARAEDGVRAVLNAAGNNVEVAAKWNNSVQAFAKNQEIIPGS